MLGKLRTLVAICVVTGLIAPGSETLRADWFESFNGDQLDLTTWQFIPFPDVTKTFTHTILTDPNGNKYLSLDETSSVGIGGSAFGGGFGSDEIFTDVRVGTVVNVVGDASRNYCGLIARATYIIDPDGSITGVAPGLFVPQVYVMHINWENGPANLRIDLEKVVNMSNIMTNEEELRLDLYVPGLDHARSYYAELDVLGSGPVYVTGSLYEYKGGPLVARTATMVDTNGNDPWEEEADSDAPFLSGSSGIFAQNEDEAPAGYHTTFDDVFSTSAGPAAVMPSPADGADVFIDAAFSWVEASFATSRELWLGKAGAMEKVDPAPAGTTYTPDNLEMGQTYQWRVDQVGPSGTVPGHIWTFTTANCLDADGFESHASDTELQAAWPHNIGGEFQYVFLTTDNQGNKSMRLDAQNQYEPYFTEVTRTFDGPQDWNMFGVETLSLSFVGRDDNVEHPFYVKLEDASGQSLKVEHPFTYACQSEIWRQWDIPIEQFRAAGVNLASVTRITIGLGSGEPSAQPTDDDRDTIFIGQISACPAG
ncbi:MAG: hypothetical protein CEE38_05935 [Planctomycetes bacterium B3_Pla]|nr:MAG: hypothetical protein CEE38_05935 [Planctomycetes bacterium B3_Pla]